MALLAGAPSALGPRRVSTGCRVVVLLLLVFVAAAPSRTSVQGLSVQFDCLTMLPDRRQLNEDQSMITPCPIAVNIGQNYVEGVQYTPGRMVRVEFKVTTDGVSSVFCRASQVLMATPMGAWIAKSPLLLPYTCLIADDALQSNYSKSISMGTILVAYWMPPLTPGNGDMEIVCTVVDVSNTFWIFNSFMLIEANN